MTIENDQHYLCRKYAPLFEIVRCLVYFLFDYYIVVQTPWQLGAGEQVVFNIMIYLLRTIHVASIALWLVQMLTGETYDDDSDGYQSGSVESINGDIKKEVKNGIDLNENIEMSPKSMTRKRESTDLNVYNLVAAALFILVAFIIMYVLYFVKVDSCNQFLNELNK